MSKKYVLFIGCAFVAGVGITIGGMCFKNKIVLDKETALVVNASTVGLYTSKSLMGDTYKTTLHFLFNIGSVDLAKNITYSSLCKESVENKKCNEKLSTLVLTVTDVASGKLVISKKLGEVIVLNEKAAFSMNWDNNLLVIRQNYEDGNVIESELYALDVERRQVMTYSNTCDEERGCEDSVSITAIK